MQISMASVTAMRYLVAPTAPPVITHQLPLTMTAVVLMPQLDTLAMEAAFLTQTSMACAIKTRSQAAKTIRRAITSLRPLMPVTATTLKLVTTATARALMTPMPMACATKTKSQAARMPAPVITHQLPRTMKAVVLMPLPDTLAMEAAFLTQTPMACAIKTKSQAAKTIRRAITSLRPLMPVTATTLKLVTTATAHA